MKDSLTLKQRAFVVEAVRTKAPQEAYRKVYDVSRMKPQSVSRAAFEMMTNPKISAEIEKLQREAAKGVMFGAAEVLREWVDIATADVNELMHIRRVNCRHCHGKDHAYQYIDAHEFAKTLAGAMDTNVARVRNKLKPMDMPTDAGGYGFAFNARPHAACPKCKGEGHIDEWVADTNQLQGKARKLFAGFKKTKDGLTIITRDQDGALANIAKALGMLTEKVKMVDPATPDTPALPLDPVEASRVYQAMMKGDPS